MPINFRIRAEVVDVRSDIPQPSDTFLVDTNVWFWATYIRASQTARPYQVRTYPTYISKVRSATGRLYRCNLSFAELAHSIERAELTIFNQTREARVETKEYRHNYPTERENVIAEIQSAWGQVKTIAQPLDLSIDEMTTDVAVERLPLDDVDGYDLFILEAMRKHKIVDVITDDGDFTTVSDIRVFTANDNVVNRASQQGRLIVRKR